MEILRSRQFSASPGLVSTIQMLIEDSLRWIGRAHRLHHKLERAVEPGQGPRALRQETSTGLETVRWAAKGCSPPALMSAMAGGNIAALRGSRFFP